MNKLLLTLSSLLVASVTAVSAHAQDAKGDAKAGEAKIAMCIGCHGKAKGNDFLFTGALK